MPPGILAGTMMLQRAKVSEEAGEKVMRVGWVFGEAKTGSAIVPFYRPAYDRVVVSVVFPDGVEPSEDGGWLVRRAEQDGKVVALKVLEGADKQHGWKPGQKGSWHGSAELRLTDGGLAGKEYEAVVEVMTLVGPFGKGVKPEKLEEVPIWPKAPIRLEAGGKLADAAWIYDYELWKQQPEEAVWYLVNVVQEKMTLSGQGQVPEVVEKRRGFDSAEREKWVVKTVGEVTLRVPASWKEKRRWVANDGGVVKWVLDQLGGREAAFGLVRGTRAAVEALKGYLLEGLDDIETKPILVSSAAATLYTGQGLRGSRYVVRWFVLLHGRPLGFFADVEKVDWPKHEPTLKKILRSVQLREAPGRFKVYTEWPFDAAEAKRRQQETAKALGVETEQEIDLGEGVKITLVLVPAGEFAIGSPKEEEGRQNNEDQKRVTIDKPFWMGKHEVTQEQWRAVHGGYNPSSRFEGAKLPVKQVSWRDIQRFFRKLNAQGGGGFGVPTEAQWEYACRAGTTTRFCFGDSSQELGRYAWHSRNADGKTHPVGGLLPNAWGLYDMHGNVHEWCSSPYSMTYDGSETKKVAETDARSSFPRGGSFLSRRAHHLRSARRARHGATLFRPAPYGVRASRTVLE